MNNLQTRGPRRSLPWLRELATRPRGAEPIKSPSLDKDRARVPGHNGPGPEPALLTVGRPPREMCPESCWWGHRVWGPPRSLPPVPELKTTDSEETESWPPVGTGYRGAGTRALPSLGPRISPLLLPEGLVPRQHSCGVPPPTSPASLRPQPRLFLTCQVHLKTSQVPAESLLLCSPDLCDQSQESGRGAGGG